MNLSEFLEARIAEDERHARAARDRVPLIYNDAKLRDLGIGIAQAGHIARWDPARVLAECQAKRGVVDAHGPDAGYCAWSQDSMEMHGTEPCETLRALAMPYADHPDFREEWRL